MSLDVELFYFFNNLACSSQFFDTLVQCEECGFHYQDKETAEKCQAWRKEQKSYNMEIISHAEENKK